MPFQGYSALLRDPGYGLERRKGLGERLHLDLPLLCVLMVLTGFGLMVLWSATNGNVAEVRRQVIFIGIAYLLMFLVAQVDLRMLKRWTPWLYLGGLILLVAVLFIGVTVNGATRWLDPPMLPRFQPAEIMKMMVPLMVAWYLGKRPMPPSLKHIFWALVIIGMPMVLIALQPDLGTSLLIAASGIFVVLLSGIRWKLVFMALGAALLSIPGLWMFYLRDYQKQRIITFLNPEREPLGAGWNIIQSKTAIGSGGLHGKGWLNGVQSRLEFLPEGQTDFIVAVLAEEFGFTGMLFLLGLYIVIIGRGLYIGAMAQDMFGRLVAGSITLTFFVYVFVNIGMVSGLLPVVGVPLPMVSLGGTAIITMLVGFGVLMSIQTRGKHLLS